MRLSRYWICWENQRRNLELSRALDCQYFQFDAFGQYRFLRYMLSTIRTLQVIWKGKPNIIFGQNPSLVLALLLVLIVEPIWKSYIVIDAHNAGVHPFEGRFPLLNLVSRWIQRRASLTIVTNEALKSEVLRNGGSAVILPDKIPDIQVIEPIKLKGHYNVLYICTFADDEPYRTVIEAGRKLGQDTYIYITGNFKKVSEYSRTLSLPSNVVLTGFLAEEHYVRMLQSVDVIMVLTFRENCLLCGAYEALAVEKPLVTSDTKALRNYFDRGVIYTKNSEDAIAANILECISRRSELVGEVRKLKGKLREEWDTQKDSLEKKIIESISRQKM